MATHPARLLVMTSLAALLLASPAMAQTRTQGDAGNQTTGTGNPAGAAPGTRPSGPGAVAPHQLNQADHTFLRQAAIGGMAEVDLARLAEQKSGSDAVKRFAQRMVQDHTKANDRLAALAKARDVPLPKTPDEEHRAMRAALEKARGADFDRTYLQGQIIDHQKTAQLLSYQIGSGQDVELKSFAADILPTVLEHLRMAQALQAEAASMATATTPTQSGATGSPSRQ